MSFMLISYDTSIFFMFVYKTYFHASRPYFDDITLLDTKLVESSCSGEFGNPSGHAIACAQCALSLYFYFTNYKYEDYFEKHKGVKYIICFLVITCVFICNYSRVYSGRHTFDQVILGFILGLVNSYFGDFYYR
jgi:membrane-associated phospholipid phosphatase